MLPPLRNFGARRAAFGAAAPMFSVAGSSTGTANAPDVTHLFPVMPSSQDANGAGFTAASLNADVPGARALRVTDLNNRVVHGMRGVADRGAMSQIAPPGMPPRDIEGMDSSSVPQDLLGARPHAVPSPGEPMSIGSCPPLGVGAPQTVAEALAIIRGRPSAPPSDGRVSLTAPVTPPGQPAVIPSGLSGAAGDGGTREESSPGGSLMSLRSSSLSSAAGGADQLTLPAPALTPTSMAGTPNFAITGSGAAAAVPEQGNEANRAPVSQARDAPPSFPELMSTLPPPPSRARNRKRKAQQPVTSGQRASSPAPLASAPAAGTTPSSPASSGLEQTTPATGLPREVATLVQASVSKGLKEGLRGVRADLTGLRHTCDAMSTTLSALCTTVNTQGVGTERTAVALQHLRGAVQGGFTSVMGVVEPSNADKIRKGKSTASDHTAASLIDAAERGDLDAMLQVADDNESKLKDIRKAYQMSLKKEMFTVNVSAKCFPTAATTRRHRLSAVQVVMGMSAEDAAAYIDSSIFFPVKKKGCKPVKRRVASKLIVTLPHIFQTMKRLIVPVYLKSINVSKKFITSDICELWLADGVYVKTPKGRAAITSCLSSVYRKDGIKERIVEPRGVGEVSYITSSLGMFAMISMLVRSYLEEIVAAELNKKKDTASASSMDPDELDGGDDDDGSECSDDGDVLDGGKDSRRTLYYTRWQEELVRVHAWVPRTTEVLYGLSIVDGADQYRAAAGPPQGDTPSDAYE